MKMTVMKIEFDRGSKSSATIKIVRAGKIVRASLTDEDGTSFLSKDESDVLVAQVNAVVTACEVFHRTALKRNRR